MTQTRAALRGSDFCAKFQKQKQNNLLGTIDFFVKEVSLAVNEHGKRLGEHH